MRFSYFAPAPTGRAGVLKFARVAGYSERFDNDAHGLELAHGAGDLIAAHVPQMVGRFEVDGVHASLETAAAGTRLRDVLLTPGDRASKLRLIDRIGNWILELGRLTRTSSEAMGVERERLRTDVLPKWINQGVPANLSDELMSIPAVAQHNDLGTWNVVVDGGDFVVVDWENARRAALPLWDLLYFLGDALVLVDGSDSPERLPGRMVRLFAGEAPSSALLFAWVRRAVEAAAVPHDAVGPIATLSWLSHSHAIGAHNLDLAERTRDHPRTHGIEGVAQAWMAHPGLGPSWSVWRG